MITLVITTFYKVCKSKTNVTVCFYILFNELGIMFSFTLKGAVIPATFLFNLSRNKSLCCKLQQHVAQSRTEFYLLQLFSTCNTEIWLRDKLSTR